MNGYDNHAGPSRGRVPKSHAHHPLSAPPTTNPYHGLADDDEDDEQTLDVIPSRAGRKLCVRHKQMANQNVNAKLQKSLDNLPTSERQDVTHLWATFSNAPHAKRKLILEGILTMCCFSQLSHLSDQLNEIIRIDPFSLLPREVNLRILGYLDAISLGRAAQVSKGWKALADDDLLWRRMCGQHIDRKCDKCGWGLPLLERRRLKVELKDFSPSAAVGIGHHHHHHGDDDDDHDHHHDQHEVSQLITRTEALGEMDKGKAAAYKTCDTAGSGVTTSTSSAGVKRSAPLLESATTAVTAKRVKIEGNTSDSDEERKLVTLTKPDGGTLTREVRLTRPWKTVYCERLLVERNWRKGRFASKTLKGHTNGVMCLQYHTALTNPSYPVLITGSYDRTVRVWNLDTGNEVRTLRGHTRAVRALQFDQMLLFTGAMDGTVRMWNWRAGECLRVLEGHTDGVVSLNYNGYLLASGSADSTIQVWNFRNGAKFTLRGHTDWVNSVVLWDGKTSPAEMDPTVIPSFSKAMGGKGRSASPHQQPQAAATDKDNDKPAIEPGTMLFSSSDDLTIKLWDLNTQTCIRTFEGHKAQVQSIKVLMVDMSEEEIRREKYRCSRPLSPLAPTGGSAFQPASRSPPAAPHMSLHTGPLSPHVSAAPPGFDPNSYRLRSRTEQVEPKSFLHTDTPDGDGDDKGKDGGERQKKPLLITGALDGTIKLWDVETGLEKATLFGHIEGVWGVDIDALRVASASHDRTVKVWDRESGNCVQTLVGHRGAVTSLQLSDDMIVSGSDDGDVMVWNFAPSASVLANLPRSPAPSAS